MLYLTLSSFKYYFLSFSLSDYAITTEYNIEDMTFLVKIICIYVYFILYIICFIKKITSNNRVQTEKNWEKILSKTWKPVFVLFYLSLLSFIQCAGALWNWVVKDHSTQSPVFLVSKGADSFCYGLPFQGCLYKKHAVQ